MKLYLHADRSEQLTDGDVLEKTQYPCGQHSICLLIPTLDADFSNHLVMLYNDGISYHGYNYLVSVIDGRQTFTGWATEIYFEYIRYKEFPFAPSRFQSVFGWKYLEDAVRFANGAPIYEITNDSGHFMADMNLLKLDFDPEQKELNARKYWSGKPMSGALDYKPLWEYIIDMPVTVIRRVS